MNTKLFILFIFLICIGLFTFLNTKKSNNIQKNTSNPHAVKRNMQKEKNIIKADETLEKIHYTKKLPTRKDNSLKEEIYLSNANEVTYYEEKIELLKNKNYQDHDEVIYEDNNNIFLNTDGERKQITSGKDEYFMPNLSSDNTYLSYEDSNGLVIQNVIENTTKKFGGDASSISWHPTVNIFLYLRTKDNGSSITESNIYLYNISNHKEILLENTAPYIAISPLFSEDGNYIYFKDDKTEKIITIDIQKNLNKRLKSEK